MKTCTKCKLEKEEEQFYLITRKDRKPYRYSMCKICASKNTQESLKRHPESKLQKNNKQKQKRKEDLEWRNRENERQRKSSYKNHIRVMLNNAKKRALKLNIEYNLTKEDIIIPEICPLLSIPFIIGNKDCYLYTPTIDRIDTLKGYTKDNIKIITMLANSMKNKASFDQLLTFSKNIESYIKI